MCFSRMNVSTDMQHDLLADHVTSRGLGLRSNFDLDFFMGKVHIFRHVLMTGARRTPNYVTSFLSSKVTAKTIFNQNNYFHLS